MRLVVGAIASSLPPCWLGNRYAHAAQICSHTRSAGMCGPAEVWKHHRGLQNFRCDQLRVKNGYTNGGVLKRSQKWERREGAVLPLAPPSPRMVQPVRRRHARHPHARVELAEPASWAATAVRHSAALPASLRGEAHVPRLQRAQPHDECRQRLPCARHAALCDPLSKRVGGAWHPGRALLRRYARSGG